MTMADTGDESLQLSGIVITQILFIGNLYTRLSTCTVWNYTEHYIISAQLFKDLNAYSKLKKTMFNQIS